jgi:hypothetical protein
MRGSSNLQNLFSMCVEGFQAIKTVLTDHQKQFGVRDAIDRKNSGKIVKTLPELTPLQKS